MPRALIIQLARLGDLLQTGPAIAAVKQAEPDMELDLLCPASLAPIGRLMPQVDHVFGWDGAQWQRNAQAADKELHYELIAAADHQIRAVTGTVYDRAYVLNQHPRALLAGALLGKETIGPRYDPVVGHLTPWAAYIRRVAQTGLSHRVHLADAFCGLCLVRPTGRAISIGRPAEPLRADLAEIGRGEGPWIGLIVGAGDPLRLVPIPVWRELIAGYVEAAPRGSVVLIGDKQECERAREIQEGLASTVQARLWDLTGRTTLTELASVLSRCHHVVGADTGPLHLAAAVGTRVIGWYFARARVHETGPYGEGHVVWQADGVRDHVRNAPAGSFGQVVPDPVPETTVSPTQWPVDATVADLVGRGAESVDGWSQWHSHCDGWGAYFSESVEGSSAPIERERTWHLLHPAHV